MNAPLRFIARSLGAVLCAVLCGARPACAIGPDNILLLVNDRSPASKEIANYYIRLRQLPLSHVVYLPLPDKVVRPEAQVTPEEFTRLIWEPTRQAVRQRGLEERIRAWVYSADMPVRVQTKPPVSITGLTFVRNEMPPEGVVANGLYASVFFRGPARAGGPQGPAVALDAFFEQATEPLPIPSMMLAWTGARGNERAVARHALEVSRMADGLKARDAPVLFLLKNDVRSRAREWQYAAVKTELEALGLQAVVTSNAPPATSRWSGLMTGTPALRPRDIGRFAPGALAEHLTSWAAVFNNPSQTKLTAWIDAGAVSSAGTITEPMSIWTKFPHARIFAHYAAGSSLLESYCYAVACPLQLLTVGDPLTRPWGERLRVTLIRADEGAPEGVAQFFASVWPDALAAKTGFIYALDDRPVNADRYGGAMLGLDTAPLADGWHRVRASGVYAASPFREAAIGEIGFTVNHKGRAVRLTGLDKDAVIDYDHPPRVGIEAEGEPERWALLVQGRETADGPYTRGETRVVDTVLAGPGPVSIQPVVYYADGMRVLGAPVDVRNDRVNRPPIIRTVRTTGSEGARVYRATVSDPENDAVTGTWYVTRPYPSGAKNLERKNGQAILRPDPSNHVAVCLFPGAAAEALTVDVALNPGTDPNPATRMAGLVFGYQATNAFYFFAVRGEDSAWVLGRCRNGKLEAVEARGAPVRGNAWYTLRVRQAADGALEGWSGDDLVCRWGNPPRDVLTGASGLITGRQPAYFRTPAVAASSWGAGVEPDGLQVTIREPDQTLAGVEKLLFEAFDGVAFAREEVEP